MARQDRLWPGGPFFFFGEEAFAPGTDSFLLGAFAKTKAGERVCDLGSGSGLLGALLLSRQEDLRITGVELNPRAVALAQETARANGWEGKLSFLTADLRQLDKLLPAGGFDVCICNPPYFQPGHGKTARDEARRLARCGEEAGLEDICAASARLLRWGGRLYLCLRPERLTELLVTLRQAGLEPKALRFVESRPGKAPSLLLLESRRGGKPGLRVEGPLRLADEAGRPTAEYREIYFQNREDRP